VIHTLGFPLYKSIGGTFIYTVPGDKIILGLVAYLDTKDPLLDPHRELQKLKTHPFIADMIKGGKVVAYGGKTLPAGGYYSMPRLYDDNMMVTGDSASLVDVQKLKGIHLAMKSGMLAAETAFEALQKEDFSRASLKSYEDKVFGSYIKKQLYRVRNFHQTLSMGIFKSLPFIALQEISGGAGICAGHKPVEDYKTTKPVAEIWGAAGKADPANQLPKPDGVLFFDKLSSVYMTGTKHDEDSPNHLLLQDGSICKDVCAPKFNSPCNHFCPANVYEMVPDEKEAGKVRLQINYTNCIHCKTCDIKCPFDNIHWTVPEGGGGPQYQET
jgi:electron-transferring-flavoprotein dehydrogenase